MNALQLNEFDEIDELTEREHFRLGSIDQVNWAFRKMGAIQAKQAEIKQLADAEINRIMAWSESESKKLENNILFFEGLLTEYAMIQRGTVPEYRKTSTPYGSIKFKKSLPKWTYDDAALLESLKANGLTDLVRIKEEPNKAELKKRATVSIGRVIDPETGAVIEGVKVEEQPDSIVIEVNNA